TGSEAGHDLGQVGEVGPPGEEDVEDRVGKQAHGQGEPVRRRAARPSGGCDGPDLTGPDAQPAGVEVRPERDARRGCAVPGHFHERAVVTEDLEAASQSSFGGGAVDHQVAVPRGVLGADQVDAERLGEVGTRRVDVDELQPVQREGPGQGGDHAADHAAADDGDAVPEVRCGVPQDVDGGLHRAGEDGAVGGNVVGNRGHGPDRDDVPVLVRVQGEHAAPDEVGRTVLDETDREVAVLDGTGQVTV